MRWPLLIYWLAAVEWRLFEAFDSTTDRNTKWQLNLFDPGGARAEIMECHAIGQPCCARSKGNNPDQVAIA